MKTKRMTMCLVLAALAMGSAAQADGAGDMTLIPSATFQMGDSLNEGEYDEFPVHTVSLNSFSMGKYEITNGQYCEFLNSLWQAGQITIWNNGVKDSLTGTSYCTLFCDPYRPNDPSKITRSRIAFNTSNNTFYALTIRGRYLVNDPMVYVSWYGAAAYCNWRSLQDGIQICYDTATWVCDYSKSGYRLPTEAEWEYAARGGVSSARFPCGDIITHDLANYYSSESYSYDKSKTRGFHPAWINSMSFEPYTSTVGYFPAEGFGLYDMTGNMQEWCNDWYAADYYANSPASNPTGPATGGNVVVRGGAYNSTAYYCRTANRGNLTQIQKGYVSFRMVYSTPAPSCPSADMSGNCFVDMADLVLFASEWLRDDCVSPHWCGKADIDTSGAVNLLDFAIMASQWLQGVTIAVPDVVGMTEADAQTAITSAELIVGTITQQHSGTVALGSVISQNPSAGENVPAGTTINLVISLGAVSAEPNITWVSINDSGAGMKDGDGNPISHGGFTGEMSKYETTNAQYCQFLNAALAANQITVHTDNVVYATSDVNHSEPYFSTEAADSNSQISYSDGIFSVCVQDGNSMADYPVVMVSWLGATAFAEYYGWRLPTEWEWQAVADYDGGFIYGCGTTISHSIANYAVSIFEPNNTTAVGTFGTYGYGMCDMAGNVWEWTSTVYIIGSSTTYLSCGGSCGVDRNACTVSWPYGRSFGASTMWWDRGFRVCRGEVVAVPDVVGMTEADAQTAITSAELIVGTITQQHSGTVALGSVISQNPSAGENVPAGSGVDIVISLGVESVEPDITWVSISDSGAGMKDNYGDPISHGGFTGEMSKYETTNAQYCQFLNAALASGDVTVSGDYVKGASGSNSGADYAGQNYYNLAGPGVTDDGATNGGAARINWTDSSFTVDSGFENHPVTYVSWYGATAFANYYGWRLPTEWEWQAVADYDGSYTFGCGTTITNSIANYASSTHPDGATTVGAFGTYGYGMCDMAGNVYEWTSTVHDSYRIIRGGGWRHDSYSCTVSDRTTNEPDATFGSFGFRVCRGE